MSDERFNSPIGAMTAVWCGPEAELAWERAHWRHCVDCGAEVYTVDTAQRAQCGDCHESELEADALDADRWDGEDF